MEEDVMLLETLTRLKSILEMKKEDVMTPLSSDEEKMMELTDKLIVKKLKTMNSISDN